MRHKVSIMLWGGGGEFADFNQKTGSSLKSFAHAENMYHTISFYNQLKKKRNISFFFFFFFSMAPADVR